MTLGSKPRVVNANAYKIYLSGVSPSNQYIMATRKEAVYRTSQKRLATGAGPVYFTMLSDDRLLLEFAYTTTELGNDGSDWNKMLIRNANSGEVPENNFFLVGTDRNPSPGVATQTMTCKAEELRLFAAAEGETIAKLSLVIIDNDNSISSTS